MTGQISGSEKTIFLTGGRQLVGKPLMQLPDVVGEGSAVPAPPKTFGVATDLSRNPRYVGHDFYTVVLSGKFDPLLDIPLFDTRIAATLIDGGVPGPTLQQVHIDLSRYADDKFHALRLVEVARGLDLRLAALGLTGIANTEFAIVPVVASMSLAGLPLDRVRLGELQIRRYSELDLVRTRVRHELGIDNPDDTAAIKNALSSVLGFELQSTRGEYLALYASDPRVGLLLEYRRLSALVEYGQALLRGSVRDGRIRCHIDQVGAATGRMTASSPNLMAFPRDPRLRKCVATSPGYMLIDADYGAVDVRVIAHVSGDANFRQLLLNRIEPHEATASFLLGRPLAGKSERNLGKPFNFKALYGAGPDAIAEYANIACGLNVSREQAAEFLDRFFTAYPGIAAWQKQMRVELPTTVRTVGGRIQYFTGGADDHCARLVHQGQGTAADGLKRALAMMHEDLEGIGARIIMTVHDEVLVESPVEHATLAAQIIESSMVCGLSEFISVPVSVTTTIGTNWGELAKFSPWGTC